MREMVDRPDRGGGVERRGHHAHVGGLVLVAVEYLDDLRKASGDPVLAALLDGASAPFDRAAWWQGLAEVCALPPLYAAARGADGAALLALTASGGVLRPLANWYTFRWQPLVTPGADPAPLLEAIARDLRRKAWRVTLTHAPNEHGIATALTAAFTRTGWFVRRTADDVNHILPIAGRSYAEYLAGRTGQLRTTLKRKSGKVACTIHRAFSDDIWAIYQSIYAESWKPQEGAPAFLERFAREESAAGRLRVGVATIDGQPAAAQLWTVEGGTAFIHKLAYRESAKAQSPGSVLTAALMAEVIDHDRVALVDFGTGDDPYKRDWMDDIRQRYQIDALSPGAPRAWPIIAKALLNPNNVAPTPARG